VTGKRAYWAVALLAIAAGVAFSIVARRDASIASPATGTPAEVSAAEFWDGVLPDLAQRQQPLKQWLGQVTVVNFWAPWCPPCRNEIPGFIRLQHRLQAQGLHIVGIALDEADKVQAFADEAGINYPILLGGAKGMELGQAAGNHMGGLPYTAVFDRHGNVVATLVGAVSEARLEGIVTPLL
jgi:thiol-disulfide isomerase/thioredoxin